MMNIIIWSHLLSTWALIGLIWFVQVAHYPLMAKVGYSEFKDYELAHQKRTTWVVSPLMLAELACAFLLFWLKPPSVNLYYSATGFILVTIIWLSTYFWQVPLHQKMTEKYDQEQVKRLVQSNWIRTIAWTLRGVIALQIAINFKENSAV